METYQKHEQHGVDETAYLLQPIAIYQKENLYLIY